MKNIIFIACLVALSSCQRSCASLERSVQVSSRYYEVKQYSDGRLIGYYRFKGILNNQEHSDGYYWYENDTLIEVSGDITVKSYN